MVKFNVGDRVKTVLHGEKVLGTCTKYTPDDPAGFVYDFEFNDGTKICMNSDRVNREVLAFDKPLPEWLEKKIKSRN